MKMSLAQSALNRLLNFFDELDATPLPPALMEQGAAIDAALAQPTPDAPAVPGMETALVMKGLDLAPPNP